MLFYDVPRRAGLLIWRKSYLAYGEYPIWIVEIYGGNYFLDGGEKTAIGYVRAALIRVKEPRRARAARPTPLPRVVQRLAHNLELVCGGYPFSIP